jgi:hypothetical protein
MSTTKTTTTATKPNEEPVEWLETPLLCTSLWQHMSDTFLTILVIAHIPIYVLAISNLSKTDNSRTFFIVGLIISIMYLGLILYRLSRVTECMRLCVRK